MKLKSTQVSGTQILENTLNSYLVTISSEQGFKGVQGHEANGRLSSGNCTMNL